MQLSTQADLRALQALPFCYLCGASTDSAPVNQDHVLARSLFARGDRTPPLKLPTHVSCNQERSGDDEAVGLLVSLLHSLRLSTPRRLPVVPRLHPSGALLASTSLDLRGCIWRWVRGYHAALYRSHLPDTVDHVVFPPLPSVPFQDAGLRSDDRLAQLAQIVTVVKQSRAVARTDTVVTHAGHCRYDSTWTRFNSGRWTCFFALRIYNWEALGDSSTYPRRGCAGAYDPFDEPPGNSAVAPEVPISISNHDPLDPFGP